MRFILLFFITSFAYSSYFSSIKVRNVLNDAYGQFVVSGETPVVSGDATYNLIPDSFTVITSGAGTVEASDHLFKINSGSSLGDYGTLRSVRSINHKSSQGSTIRFSGRFVSNAANTESGIGAFNLGDEYSFGYSGTTFGIWHRYGGAGEIQDITITTPAAGAETVTLVLDGTTYNIPVTSGTSQHNAYEISEYLKSNLSGSITEQIDNKVKVFFLQDEDKAGTFSCASSGALVCSLTEVSAGAQKTSNHIAMSSWNRKQNAFTGFDPSKGNYYQVIYQTGFGNIKFFVFNPTTNLFELVHELEWLNNNTTPNLANASLHAGGYAVSFGGSNVEVNFSHITAFISGIISKTRNPRSYKNTEISVGTTFTNILTVRNSATYNGLANQVQVQPLFVTVTNDGSKEAECEIRLNANINGETNFQEITPKLVSYIETSGGSVSGGGDEVVSFPVPRLGNTSVSIHPFDIFQAPNTNLTVSCRLTSGNGDISASLIWYEDV